MDNNYIEVIIIKEEILFLNDKFEQIKKMGWIKSLRNGTTGIGYTFETLLSKKEDHLQKPDFNGIEIKTMKYFSKKKIHLFNLTPDGDILHPIKTIVEQLGYPDKDFPKFNVFNVSINTNEIKKVGKKQIKLFVNKYDEKIELLELCKNGDINKLNISWSFQSLKEVLMLKLNTLSIVKACYKKVNDDDYFYYNKINYYKLKTFEDFIFLIEKGIITITFKIGIKKNTDNLGEIHDRGTDFSVLEENIEMLFNKINI